MFDDYAKKLEQLGEDVPKIFKTVAKKSAVHFRNEAVKLTDEEGLVDTGNYRRNWKAEVIEPQKNVYGIVGMNNVEYASWLEEGHGLRGINDNRKYKIKRPENIDRRKVRYKGFFVGKRALTDTEGFALLELFDEIQISMLSKRAGIPKAEAKKYYK